MNHIIPILIAYTFAAMSPGPSVVFVIENASFGPRRLARIAGLGVSLGSFVWVAAVVFGVGTLLRTVPGAAFWLKIGSAALLSYFLIKTVIAIAQPKKKGIDVAGFTIGTPGATFIKGMMINLINPASLVFYLSLLAPMMAETQQMSDLIACLIGITIISLVWYQILVSLVAHPRVQPLLLNGERYFRVGFASMYLYFLIRLFVRA